MGDSSKPGSDYKLYLQASVVLERLDFAQHLYDLSEDCLHDLHLNLTENVSRCIQESAVLSSDAQNVDDDILVVAEKRPAKAKTTKLKLKRPINIKKNPALRKRNIFSHAVKSIFSKSKDSSSDMKSESGQFNESLTGAMDLVNDKLTLLREREAKLMAMVKRKKKIRPLDNDVNEELEALKQLDRSEMFKVSSSGKPIQVIQLDQPEPVFPSTRPFSFKQTKPDTSQGIFMSNKPDPLKPAQGDQSEGMFLSKSDAKPFSLKPAQAPVFPPAKIDKPFSFAKQMEEDRVQPMFQQSLFSKHSEQIFPKSSPVKTPKKEKANVSSDHNLDGTLSASSKSFEEKYHALDARDKIIQSRRETLRKRKLVGTCPDMCPEKERYRRNYQLQVSPFEMVDYPRNNDVKEEWMVKDYSRSSADQDTPLPHDLRPVPVLQRTMAHLCRNIADRCEYSSDMLDEWYMFMWYRTRAIRKDLTHQDICSKDAVTLFEQCARFHISCAEGLIDQDISVYDDKINTENLTKCLQTLKYMYNDLRAVGTQCQNASEFLSYSLLLNLNNTAIMTEIQNMPPEVNNSKSMRFALDIITARESKNYIRFFNLVKKTTFLNACILRRYFTEMRVQAVASMIRSHCRQRLSSVPVPLLPLVDNLLFNYESDCVEFLSIKCNLHVEQRYDGPYVLLDRNRFSLGDLTSLQHPCYSIREKKEVPLSELFWGGPLDQETLQPPLQNSFEKNGELKLTLPLEEIVESDPEEVDEIYMDEEDVAEEIDDGDGIMYCEDEHGEPQDDEVQAIPKYDVPSEMFAHQADPKPSYEEKTVIPSFVNAPKVVFEPQASVPISSGLTPMTVPEDKPVLPTAFMPPTINVFDNSKVSAEETEPDNEMESKAEQLKIEEDARKVEAQKQRMEELLAQRLEEEEREEKRLKEQEKKQAEMVKLRILRERKNLQAQNEIRTKKLGELKAKYRVWKLGQFVRRWRSRACTARDAKKMEKYVKSLSISYPAVCSSDVIHGNPFGLVIPSALQVHRKSSGLRLRPVLPNFRGGVSGPPPVLPLVNIGQVVAGSLLYQVKSLYPDATSSFRSYFPWKLVISLPDGNETNVRFDTFIEMHFVDRFDWKFGVETGPICSMRHKIEDLELDICVRRVRGRECFEGDRKTPEALEGANSVLFFLTDDYQSLRTAFLRLNFIRSRPGGEIVPIVIFVLGKRLPESTIREKLDLDGSNHVIMCSGNNQQSLVTALSGVLSLAASICAPVPTARTAALSSVLGRDVLGGVWGRAQLAVSQFQMVMINPDQLISYYNRCLDSLYSVFSPKRELRYTAPEFSEALSKLEGIQITRLPVKDVYYKMRLTNILEQLKLPPWPTGKITSTNQLNYRIHKYAVMITKDKEPLSDLKWRVYQVIKNELLWKGLDIYCEEDIQTILQTFPWVNVLKEFANTRVQMFISSNVDIAVNFEPEEIKDFAYNTPLLYPSMCFTEKGASDISMPAPENDSILIAYAKAVERQMELEEALKNPKPTLSEQVTQALETYAVNPENPDESNAVCGLKRGFEDLNDSISHLTNGLEKRRKILEEMAASFEL